MLLFTREKGADFEAPDVAAAYYNFPSIEILSGLYQFRYCYMRVLSLVLAISVSGKQ